MRLLVAILLAASASGCLAAPAVSDELSERGAVERTSDVGLAEGRLTALGPIARGENDFELALSAAPPYESIALTKVVALMPGHGHRAEPAHVAVTEAGYRIVGLPLTMSGVWQLRSRLVVDERADELSFEVDVP